MFHRDSFLSKETGARLSITRKVAVSIIAEETAETAARYHRGSPRLQPIRSRISRRLENSEFTSARRSVLYLFFSSVSSACARLGFQEYNEIIGCHEIRRELEAASGRRAGEVRRSLPRRINRELSIGGVESSRVESREGGASERASQREMENGRGGEEEKDIPAG